MQVDITRGEATEKELDNLIRRRHERRVLSEGERPEEALWAESERRYFARREEENRLAWCEHFRRMRAAHWRLGNEYDRKLRHLENGHHENGHKKGDAA
jgi:hypothetical protein